MKIKLIHAKNEMSEVLNVKKDRLSDIMRAAQTTMMKEHARGGTKAKFLECVIDECENINEVVAATISWKEVTDHMQRVQASKAQSKSKIIKPKNGSGIIRPIK